ncbi:hypothetical protein [Clostridium oceanicum]|uniref:Uncharacterized protein n=1 Tax=Clostridium oceanicum TaxID=1543 RepID=A0ABN1JBP7_9CLOT
MIQMIDAKKLLKGSLNKLGMTSKDTFVFGEESTHKNHYTKIIKFNYILKSVEEFKLKKEADLISNVTLNKVLYYGKDLFDLNEKKNYIKIYKFDCDEFKDDFITKIEIGNCKDKIDLRFGGILTGIDYRYAILLIPDYEVNGESFFKDAFLIDSILKKSYSFKNIIGQKEEVLKIDSILVDYSGEYIAFKTGRIGDFEKKEFYDEYKNDLVQSRKVNNIIDKSITLEPKKFKDITDECSTIEPKKFKEIMDKSVTEFIDKKEIYDNEEDLIICEKDEFINKVKNKVNLNRDRIIEKCKFDKSVRLISMDNDKIYYLLRDFKSSLKYLKSYDFKSKEIKTIEVEEKYDYIEMHNNKFYGFIKKEDSFFDVYSIRDNYKILESDGEAFYVDEKILVSGNIILKDDKFTRYLKVYNVKDGSILDSFEFTNMCFDFIEKVIVFW